MMNEYTLLTIDDEASIRRSIRAFFEDLGCTVWEASDGETGLREFWNRRPQVALVDLRMPGISGLDVIDALSRKAPETPVVVLSGTGVVADAIEAIRRGAWDYVMKPIRDMAELEHVVKSVMERARLREENRQYQVGLEKEIALRIREFRESEERYRDLVENMNDAIYMVDRDGTVSYVSPAIERMAGYTPKEVIGKNFKTFFVNEQDDRMMQEFGDFLGGEKQEGEYILLKKTGEPIWVRISSRPTVDGNYISGIQGILTDITDRKRTEQQLEKRTQELGMLNSLGREMAAEFSVEEIVHAALSHAMTSVRPDLSILFLRKDQDLILNGLLPREKMHSGEDVPIHRVGQCLCGLAAREMKAIYSKNIHSDPRCTFTECKQSGFFSFGAIPLMVRGEVIGVIGMASREPRDFSERSSFLEAFGHEVAIGLRSTLLFQKVQTDAFELQKRLSLIQQSQEEKESLILQLHRAQKLEAIGTLAGGIAHDFNNILTPIMVGTELAMMSVPQEGKIYPTLKRVLEAGTRAKDLVKQILTFSRQGNLEKRPMKVGSTIKEAIKLARAALPATIEIRQDIGIENGVVQANPSQIHQLIMNLITNAAHAMKEKGGILEIALEETTLDATAALRLEDHLRPGPFLKLTVRDTGHGMDKRTQEKVFDPFFTTKARGEGTGLGLATVYGIVRGCEGAISVESEPGKGTLFGIYLPRLSVEIQELQPDQTSIPLGKESLLFVDDEPVIVEIYADMLKSLGYSVDARTDPSEALTVFRANPDHYDLVLTDMAMPGMTGEDLGTEVMKIRPQIPVILCTGFSERMTEERASELGFCGFAMKPVVIREIAEKIRKALDGVKRLEEGV